MSLEEWKPPDIRQSDEAGAELAKPLPLFAENMLEIGKIVSRRGVQHPAYQLNLIHILDCAPDSEGFESEVYLEPFDDPQIVLNGHYVPLPDGYKRHYLEISYRSDTRTSLRINDFSRYPEAAHFERPQSKLPPGNIFVDHEDSLFLWMRAEFLGPNVVRFLDNITSQGLAELQSLSVPKLPQQT